MKNDNEGSKKMVYLHWSEIIFEIILVLIIFATIAGIEIAVALKRWFMGSMEMIALFNSFMWILVLVTSYLNRRRLVESEGEETYKQVNQFFLFLAISSIVTEWNYIEINLWIGAVMFVCIFLGIPVTMFVFFRKRTSPAITPSMEL
ncbi:hypothetical protein HY061_02410 [Candidatus Azambacteria bacterium]|nr:hypothetical protein [Candidatus Azambacteria bacterium]